jgi:hypothetical protein
VAIGGFFAVEGDADRVGTVFLDVSHEDIEKTVNGIRVDPIPIRQQGDSVKGAVQDTVPVYQHKFFHNGVPFFFGVLPIYYTLFLEKKQVFPVNVRNFVFGFVHFYPWFLRFFRKSLGRRPTFWRFSNSCL